VTLLAAGCVVLGALALLDACDELEPLLPHAASAIAANETAARDNRM
jgi:hypothetical protein